MAIHLRPYTLHCGGVHCGGGSNGNGNGVIMVHPTPIHTLELPTFIVPYTWTPENTPQVSQFTPAKFHKYPGVIRLDGTAYRGGVWIAGGGLCATVA